MFLMLQLHIDKSNGYSFVVDNSVSTEEYELLSIGKTKWTIK